MTDNNTFPPGHFNVNTPFNPEGKMGEYKEFIGVYPNSISQQDCQFIIDAFNQHDSFWHEDDQFSKTRSLGRYDRAVSLDKMNGCGEFPHLLRDTLFDRVDEYKSIFTAIDVPLYFSTMKMQCTPPGGGYHVWHAENCDLQDCDRAITWMLYLNNITEGGETEFLYQGQRISPTAGTIVLWPAGYTHPHRGNPPLKETKYIITGWFLYMPT